LKYVITKLNVNTTFLGAYYLVSKQNVWSYLAEQRSWLPNANNVQEM